MLKASQHIIYIFMNKYKFLYMFELMTKYQIDYEHPNYIKLIIFTICF